MYNVYKENQSITLVMLFPLFFILMPRPEIQGVQFLTYPTIAAIFGLLALVIITKNGFHKSNVFPLLLMTMLFTCIALSAVFNSTEISSLGHLAKIILFMVVFVFGHLIGSLKKKETIFKGLLKMAYIVLVIQAVVSLTQLFANPAFGWLYSMDKTRPIGGMVRIAGTMDNPNLFAWIVIQMAVIIFMFEPKKLNKLFWVALVFVLVFLSGSRSFLVLFPAVMVFVYVLSSKKSALFTFVKLPMFLATVGVVVVMAYQFLVNNAMKFPYLSQLLLIFETGELSSINSFYVRTLMWRDALSQMNGPIDWLFGLGPGAIEVLDNDYLYATVNYGIIFSIVNILVYLVLAARFLKCKDSQLMALGLQYIVFSLIIGYQADTISGWNYPLLIMFYAGITIALSRVKSEKKINKAVVQQTTTL
jgi:hypothetical protein